MISNLNLNLSIRTPPNPTTTTATATATATSTKKDKTTMKTTKMKKRNVRLNNKVSISEIPKHSTYTEYEKLSSWYTDDDYLLFKLDHEYRCLRYDKEQRSACVKAVQYLVLQAQYNERIYIVNSDPRAKKFDLFKQWLSEFYCIHSKQCTIAGQQRALENYREITETETNESESNNNSTSPSTTLSSSPLMLSSSLFLLEPIYRDHDQTTTVTPIIPNNNNNNNTHNNNNNSLNSRILGAAQALMMVDTDDGDSNSNSNSNTSSHCKRLSAAIESCPSAGSGGAGGEMINTNTMIMPIKRNGKRQRRNSFVCIF
jgi:hypothetical protein